MARDHAFTLSTKSVRAIAANFHARDRAAQRRIKKLVRDTSENLYSDVWLDTPKDTYFSVSVLQHRITEKGYGYEVGWREKDYTDAGFAEMYIVYPLFGTRFIDGRDFLFTHRDHHDTLFREGLRRELSAAIARGRR